MTSVGPPLILAVRELVAGGFVVYATLDEIRESVTTLEDMKETNINARVV